MIDLNDIHTARDRIAPYIRHTPILTSHSLDEETHHSLFLKGEHLQRTGSFKIRGAMNTLLQIPDAAEVCAVSSGNHGQAVACAARLLGKHATIVMPEDSSPTKVAATRAYGATVVQEGITVANREERVREIAELLHAPLVHPFDDERVIAGQGTIGFELDEELSDCDAIVIAIGGGGLIGGIATAIKSLRPDIEVIGVEPRAANDAQQSLAAHRRIRLETLPVTQADAVRAMQLGELTFPIIERYVDRIISVDETIITTAHQLILERTKQFIEPTAALPLAAVLSEEDLPRRLCLILCGGNWGGPIPTHPA